MPPKRRRRFQGLYYHSSPPKIIPMNGQSPHQNDRKRRDFDDFSVKLSTIRIWMHEKDIGKLTRILWAGQGNRLRQQASTNPKVKRFLAAVPYVMNAIKEIHQAVVDNNLETLQAKLEPPVPPALVTCKDANGLNVIHKAAGLGHTKMLEYLVSVWPDGTNETDITGKTPLHWAASAKNNMRCYTLLTNAGCDEEAVDYKMKTPSYYRHKPHEIERAFLVYVPEAPRVSPDIVTDWDALSGDSGDGKKLDIKIPDTNGYSGRINGESIENTSEADLNDGVSVSGEDEMSKDDEVAIVQNGEESAPATPENSEGKDENTNQELDDENTENEENNTRAVNETTTTILENGDNGNTEKEDNEKEIVASENVGQEENEAEVEDSLAEKDEGEKIAKKEDEVETVEVEKKDNSDEIEQTNEDEKEKTTEVEEEKSVEEKSIEENKDAKSEVNDDIVKNETVANTIETVDDIVEESSDKMQENDKGDEVNTEREDCDETNKTEEHTNGDEVETETVELPKMEISTEAEIKDMNAELAAETVEKVNKIMQQDLETGEKTCVDVDDGNGTEQEIQHENAIANDTEIQADKVTESIESKLEAVEKDNAEKKDNDDGATANVSVISDIVRDTTAENVSDDMAVEEQIHKDEKQTVEGEGDGKGEGEVEESDDGEEDENDEELLGEDSEDNAEDNDFDADAEAEPETEQEEGFDAQTADGISSKETKYAASSPTSSLAIEGFVQGSSEDNTVQSQSAAYVDEESRIQEIIAAGNMEQLAQIVLNGDGKKLQNMQTPEPDIQAFLNNVPNYMDKIRRVHDAARGGSLLSLQQALDRRKFAIAKDEISPNGASPLHVAVLFGHSDIVRYLAARFTETTAITDNDGRTALHYAATIKDNGHFYNLLTQLGANAKAVDKLGHTPEFYLDAEQAQDVLTYRQLLGNFGAEDMEEELLSDQGHVESQSYQANPIFKTEQGKYLANTLADPLIKALTEIANKRPDDPVAFLTGFLQNYMHARNPGTGLGSRSGKTNSTAMANSSTPQIHKTHVNNNVNDSYGEDDGIATGDEEAMTPQLEDRDEHGQSMLHFACARSHRRGALMHLIEESNVDVAYRDELYRTARDVSLQANQPANAKEIDTHVLSLAVVGDVRPFEQLALAGYDHIIDVVDEHSNTVVDIASNRGHEELVDFLRNLRTLEESREELHQMIRDNNIVRLKEMTTASNAKWLLKAKNYYGRTALHIAVLKESQEIVEHLINHTPEALRIGDNLERTALHYAMGANAVESLSRVLIQNGAKRTSKDLKGRQPSYYFMNKADILRLQEEEEESR